MEYQVFMGHQTAFMECQEALTEYPKGVDGIPSFMGYQEDFCGMLRSLDGKALCNT